MIYGRDCDTVRDDSHTQVMGGAVAYDDLHRLSHPHKTKH